FRPGLEVHVSRVVRTLPLRVRVDGVRKGRGGHDSTTLSPVAWSATSGGRGASRIRHRRAQAARCRGEGAARGRSRGEWGTRLCFGVACVLPLSRGGVPSPRSSCCEGHKGCAELR